MPNRSLTLLVADDDPVATRMLCAQAQQMGHRVLGTAANGPEAVAMAGACRPDLVLMDLHMPDPATGVEDPDAGITATRTLMRSCPVPVVILSAFESPELVDKASEAGAGAYLMKPASDRELARGMEIARARFEDQQRLLNLNDRLREEVALHRRMEADLRESRRRLDLLLEQTPMAVVEWDQAFRIVLWNPGAERLFGRSRLEATGGHALELLLPQEERPRFEREYAARIPSGASLVTFHHCLRPDGREVHGQWFTTPLLDELGCHVGAALLCMDVTERRQAEQALEASEARYRALVDNSGEGIGMVDRDETFLFANPSSERIFGVERGGLQGRNLRDFLEPDQLERVRAQTRRRLQGFGGSYELEIRRPDGQHRLVHISATPQFGATGEVQNAFAVFTDTTEARMAERALGKSEARLRALLSSAPVAMIAVDPSGLVTLSRGRVMEALDLDEDDTVGRSVVAVFGDQPRLMEAFAGALRGEERREHVEIRGLRFECHVSPLLDEQEHPDGALLVILDLQDRLRAEEAEHQARKLESLALMAGGIAHDFNNLLQVMSGHLELAQDRLDAAGAAGPSWEAIRTSLDRATALTAQLLHFSGSAKYDLASSDLATVVERARGTLEGLCGPEIAVVLELAPGLPAVSIDATHVLQALVHLATNAREAMGGRGTLTVRVNLERLEIVEDPGPADRFLRPGTFVGMEILDTGAGIPLDTLPRILDPFFTTKFTGRGLGLPTVLGILKAHEAGLRVRTRPGAGSSFQALFPLAETEPHRAVEPPAEPRAHRSGLVLVVDDEPEIREAILEVLEELGRPTASAADGQEAVDFVRAHPGAVALVILDLTMPRMGGREAFLALRQLDPGLRVVISSGYSLEGVMDSFRDSEPDAFLPKPYRLKDLRDLLGRLLP